MTTKTVHKAKSDETDPIIKVVPKAQSTRKARPVTIAEAEIPATVKKTTNIKRLSMVVKTKAAPRSEKATKIEKPVKVIKAKVATAIEKPTKTVAPTRPAKKQTMKFKPLSKGQRTFERRMKQAARDEGIVFRSSIVRSPLVKKDV